MDLLTPSKDLAMSDQHSIETVQVKQNRSMQPGLADTAINRWENEGGATTLPLHSVHSHAGLGKPETYQENPASGRASQALDTSIETEQF
jgi:hypothetical protein